VQELGGSRARQPAQAGQGKYSIPQMSCSVYEWGLARGGRTVSFFLVSMSSNPLLSGSSIFSGSSVFFGSSVEFEKSTGSSFHDHCLGTDCNSVIGW